MKKLLLLATLLFSTSIFAANVEWFDMEVYSRYKLTQDIVFEDGKTFKAGSQFDMFDLAGGVGLGFIELHHIDCKNVNETSELSLVDVAQPDGKPTVVIGALLEEGCNVTLYVELSEFFTKSAFELVE